MSTKCYYFAYGMNTDTDAMALRTGTPIAIGRGLVRDHAFRFAVHADVFPEPGTITHGVLWELDDQQLASLDIREGYPRYYDRKIVTVEAGGQSYDAWMYFMTPGHPVAEPYESYYEMLTRGYTTFGVPLKQIIDARRDAVAAYRKSPPVDPRWFDSYEDLLRQHVGHRRVAGIQREADSQGLTLEQLCQDYVEYGIIHTPDHYLVLNADYSRY